MTASDTQLILSVIGCGAIGLFVGRFLNICIERFPAHDALSDQLQSLKNTWSVCRHCQAAPRPVHRLPLISWVTGSGRCHACSRKLPRAFPVIEVITALLFALMYWRESGFQGGDHQALGVALVIGAAVSYSLYVLFAKPTMQVIGSRHFTSH